MRSKLFSHALLLAVFLLLPIAPFHAQTKCANDKKLLNTLEAELAEDNAWLAKWCANSLSSECQQQGPGFMQAIHYLNEEIAAQRQLVQLDCGLTPPPKQAFVRHSIFTLTPAQIASLRNGVLAMQSRPCDTTNPTDPTKCSPISWQYQANIHGTGDTPVAPLWNQCQHGSFYFFSWHRMYLYFFERILRAASGDPTLTLPYWNYTDDPNVQEPYQRQLPPPFWQPAIQCVPLNTPGCNPLFITERDPSMNNGTGFLYVGDVDYSAAFKYTNFEAPVGSGAFSFGGPERANHATMHDDFGALESTPHNVIHDDIGGWMSDPNRSANDPIFYLHHANIDRLWKRWLDQGAGRQNPTSDQVWMTTMFTFYDVTLDQNGQQIGKQVQLSGQQILDTVSQLDYCYDDDPPCGIPAHPGAIPPITGAAIRPGTQEQVVHELGSSSTKVQLATEPVTVRIPLVPEARRQMEAAGAPSAETKLLLSIEGITAEKIPDVHYQVFVGLPEGQKPDYKSVYFVGNLSFFGIPSHVSFDISNTVRELVKSKSLSSTELPVTFVMRWLEDRDGNPLPVPPGVRVQFTTMKISSVSPK
ncbi:MAG: tyrosinase family protein [Candidatus Acidiferrales bacterium]